jgi:hypothetical protein
MFYFSVSVKSGLIEGMVGLAKKSSVPHVSLLDDATLMYILFRKNQIFAKL